MKGAYTSKNSKIPGYILMEYENLGLVDTIESSSRPGIYMSKDKKSFRKFIDTEDGVKEIESKKPDVKDLQNGLSLLKRIRDAFPWQSDKFAATVKMSLLHPYGFTYKRFRRWLPGIVLIGESGTLKSTMGELLLCLHAPIYTNKSHYIMNGSEFGSDFRMGRDLSRHSYPIVVNECNHIFRNSSTIEFLKDVITEEFGRNPGTGPNGEEGQVYYNRSVPIFTLNDSVEAMEEREFARRFLTINLSKNDLYTEQQIEENLGFLNQNGIVNERFQELSVIGDFIFYYINSNMDVFAQSIYKTMDTVIGAMAEYSQMDLSWLNVNVKKYIDMDIDESTQGELEYALDVIRRPFFQKKSKTYGGKSDSEILSSMFGNEYSYILETNNGVVITRGFEDEFRKRDPLLNRSMKVEVLGELIQKTFEGTDDCGYKRVRVKGMKQRPYGLYIPMEVFYNIVGATDNKSITEELSPVIDNVFDDNQENM